jgi:hypothetical protein
MSPSKRGPRRYGRTGGGNEGPVEPLWGVNVNRVEEGTSSTDGTRRSRALAVQQGLGCYGRIVVGPLQIHPT